MTKPLLKTLCLMLLLTSFINVQVDAQTTLPQRPNAEARKAILERLNTRQESSMLNLLDLALLKDDPALDPDYSPWRSEFLQKLYKLDKASVLAYLRSRGDSLWNTISPKELFDILGWDEAHTIPSVFKQVTWYYHDAEFAKAMIWPQAWASGDYPELKQDLIWFEWSSSFSSDDYKKIYSHWKKLAAPLEGLILAMKMRAGLVAHFARPERSLSQDEVDFRALLVSLGIERDSQSLKALWNRPQGGPILNIGTVPLVLTASFTPSGSPAYIQSTLKDFKWLIQIPWTKAPQGTTGISIKPGSTLLPSSLWPQRLLNFGVLKSFTSDINLNQGQTWALICANNHGFEQAYFVENFKTRWLNRDYAREVRTRSLEEINSTNDLPRLDLVGLWVQKPMQDPGNDLSQQNVTLGSLSFEYDKARISSE